jgi:hypothetical protein
MAGVISSRCVPAAGITCGGIPFPPFGRCLEHLISAEVDQALSGLKPGADIDVSGTRFAGTLHDRLKAAVTDADGKTVFGTARFSGARFESTASFDDARFTGDASFDGAYFAAGAAFAGATFGRDASFADARFEGEARFADILVKNHATFRGARFSSTADFTRATFQRDVSFSQAAFDGEVALCGVCCQGSMDFRTARFGAARLLGPLAVRDVLDFDSTSFEQQVTVEAAASRVLVVRATFAGATLRFDYAEVCLDHVTSSAPVTVVAAARPVSAWNVRPARVGNATVGQPPGLTLLSFLGVDASQLLLVDVDLSECRFADTLHLDELRFEGSRSHFAYPPRPRGWQRVFPPTRRQLLAEEWDWRAGRRPFTWPARQHAASALAPERILTAYRQLRKAQEDAKNEPGAADFYYGEMEMRRHSSTTTSAEKLILGLYWAVSGYGLRAARALWALGITLALSTAAFATFGFAPSQAVRYLPLPPSHQGLAQAYQQVTVTGPRPGWLSAFFYSLQSSTSLLSSTVSALPLTGFGEVVQIALKLLGPIFVGLAILAVRNRIKR